MLGLPYVKKTNLLTLNNKLYAETLKFLNT